MITVIIAMMIVLIIMIKIRTISEYFQDIFEKNELNSFSFHEFSLVYALIF